MTRGERRHAAAHDAPAFAGPATCRLDVLLHHLCLAPTRSQAARAIDDGAVTLNGAAARPAHLARAGDTLAVTIGRRTRTYALLAVPGRGQSRKDAPRFYRLLADEDTAR